MAELNMNKPAHQHPTPPLAIADLTSSGPALITNTHRDPRCQVLVVPAHHIDRHVWQQVVLHPYLLDGLALLGLKVDAAPAARVVVGAELEQRGPVGGEDLGWCVALHHGVRGGTIISVGAVMVCLTWEQEYVGGAHIISSLYHACKLLARINRESQSPSEPRHETGAYAIRNARCHRQQRTLVSVISCMSSDGIGHSALLAAGYPGQYPFDSASVSFFFSRQLLKVGEPCEYFLVKQT